MRVVGVEQDFKAIWESRSGGGHVGHAHFWDRALSRRQLIGGAASVAGVALGSALRLPAVARAATRPGAAPEPIPGGTQIDGLGFFHFYFPTFPNPAGDHHTIENGRGDPSSITDFNGFIGSGEWGGGTGTNQNGKTLFWAADVRFMDGAYVGLDGRQRQGAFAFV
jgi:hypothetical protein